MNEIVLSLDAQGSSLLAPPPSDIFYGVNLAVNTNTILIVPASDSSHVWAAFSYQPGSEIWIAINNTATFPSTSSFVVLNSFPNVAQYRLKSGDQINMLNAGSATARVGVTFYGLSK